MCEIAYAEWTDDGELRQTTFLGWRDDKKPDEVVLEHPYDAIERDFESIHSN